MTHGTLRLGFKLLRYENVFLKQFVILFTVYTDKNFSNYTNSVLDVLLEKDNSIGCFSFTVF